MGRQRGMEQLRSLRSRSSRDQSTQATWSTRAEDCSPSIRGASRAAGLVVAGKASVEMTQMTTTAAIRNNPALYLHPHHKPSKTQMEKSEDFQKSDWLVSPPP
ncbi:hypothetical protein PS2_014189 [Malus domestica]